MRMLASYIMRGRIQAILSIAVCAALSFVLPPLSYLSAAGVGLVTLRRGSQEGLTVSLGVAVVLALLAWIVLAEPVAGFTFALVMGLPLWVLGSTLRSKTSLALTLGVAALMGILLIIVVHAVTTDTTAWWRETLTLVLKPALLESGMLGDSSQIDVRLAQVAKIFTGLLAASLVLGLMLSLFIARWWQAMLYNPGGFQQEFRGLRLSAKFALPTLLLIALVLLTPDEIGRFASEVLVVVVVVYMIQGLAFVHRVVAARKAHYVWLVALYGLLLLALPQMGVMLAAAGFTDSWLHRVIKNNDSVRED